MKYFAGLKIVDFCGTHDKRQCVEEANPNVFVEDSYACGMCWLQPPHQKDNGNL